MGPCHGDDAGIDRASFFSDDINARGMNIIMEGGELRDILEGSGNCIRVNEYPVLAGKEQASTGEKRNAGPSWMQ